MIFVAKASRCDQPQQAISRTRRLQIAPACIRRVFEIDHIAQTMQTDDGTLYVTQSSSGGDGVNSVRGGEGVPGVGWLKTMSQLLEANRMHVIDIFRLANLTAPASMGPQADEPLELGQPDFSRAPPGLSAPAVANPVAGTIPAQPLLAPAFTRAAVELIGDVSRVPNRPHRPPRASSAYRASCRHARHRTFLPMSARGSRRPRGAMCRHRARR
ncbi:hypothetical protein FBZ94_113114 [Bradyrhizobium sacchari]|uniref:Uncharacterized protein n=1 Tax=Bradyrhizobium sacchari TaxID=1399419 RepID=A0A560HV27_9BRAD|nr:hypothetical protein FBZ94_113114 [Bradyrhizobium sacchari]TWB68209.1 hypothetical protein FBZ95_112114 [Bradyrhizobium sacchari]